jgi:hypothetical protein
MEMPDGYAPLARIARNLQPILMERYGAWMGASRVLLLVVLGFAGFCGYRWLAGRRRSGPS